MSDKQNGAFIKKKRKLLNIAARLIMKKGFAAMSMNEIAKGMGITKATLYHYYANKEEIALEIEQLNYEYVQKIFTEAEANYDNGLERLKIFFLGYSKLMTTPTGAAGVQIASIPHSRELKKRYTVYFKQVDSRVRKYIVEGQKDGSISKEIDSKWSDFIMFGALHWIPMWYSSKAELNAEKIADELFNILLKGLGPR